jgi:heme/copper-type cytochrome/quinol oxidase subunit 3
VFAALLVLSSAALQLVSRDERAGRFAGRAAKLGIAFALGIAALVVQVVEWASLGFGPADGGYASVFVGWTGFFFLFVILALIWIEVELAGAIRRPRDPSPGVRAASFYWSFIAGIGLLTWVVLYLVAP